MIIQCAAKKVPYVRVRTLAPYAYGGVSAHDTVQPWQTDDGGTPYVRQQGLLLVMVPSGELPEPEAREKEARVLTGRGGSLSVFRVVVVKRNLFRL